MKITRWLAGAAVSAALIATTAASASAASPPAGAPQPSGQAVHACVNSTGQIDYLQFRAPAIGTKCNNNDALWIWALQGSQGPTGPAGPKGDTGPQGPSGVVASTTTDMGAVSVVNTGGPFVANATEVGAGKLVLQAGTYLISMNAKATPLMTSNVQVFPQFFLYDQPANGNFSGDELNIGSGALESGGNTSIDSYYTGTGQITLTQTTTMHAYAFGYDSDTGSGTYHLDDLSITATQINPGS
jgi:hypothetical protein